MSETRRTFLLATAAAGALEVGASPHRDRHVVLLGDSIFDNARYVPGKPAVIEQLRSRLGEKHRATLCAVDGHVTADVAGQLPRVPADATHLVLSAGGNDALQHVGLLDKAAERSSDLLPELARIREQFGRRYAAALAAVRKRGLPTAVCTIYDSNFEQPNKRLADVVLCVFNDAILRCAGDAGVPVLDLRRIFAATPRATGSNR